MTLQSQPVLTDAAREDTTDSAAELAAMVGPVTIHLPGDPAYDEARRLWNTAVDLLPAAIAEPTTAAEVSAVVTASRKLGLKVAPVSTGHNAGPLVRHDLTSTVLVKLSSMTAVEVDPSTAMAKVQGGALWGDVIDAAGAHGLACLHGSSPDVGVGGYLLGGGIFLYARRLGMATSSLTAVEIVLVDGQLVRADRTQHQSLFWALRGGGGSFGIVTSFEFSLYPLATVHAGMMVWDIDDAERVVRAWAEWAPEAPEEITTSMRILNLPQSPDIPKKWAAVRSSAWTAPSWPTKAVRRASSLLSGSCRRESTPSRRCRPARSHDSIWTPGPDSGHREHGPAGTTDG
ncbi:FAD-binding oxidoreductase [Brevibacterium renqingii]|uniref:FAD-binding oxidoreductase n=1 Tax=Brevibacterium renqingii TaxID=2776916 RepID=UPI001AE053DE|nr:FAD-binding oxidoreductase [Brevibacterium renqingii]